LASKYRTGSDTKGPILTAKQNWLKKKKWLGRWGMGWDLGENGLDSQFSKVKVY